MRRVFGLITPRLGRPNDSVARVCGASGCACNCFDEGCCRIAERRRGESFCAPNRRAFQPGSYELRKGTAEANARAAEATQKAAEAQLALEKFKQPRVLAETKIRLIAYKLKRFAGTRFDASVSAGDTEAIVFLSNIAATLGNCGVDIDSMGHPRRAFPDRV